MFDTSKKVRTILNEEPLFGEFLKEKGFTLNMNSPIMFVVSFDDVAKRKGLDKAAFLAEYSSWKDNCKKIKAFEIKRTNHIRYGMM